MSWRYGSAIVRHDLPVGAWGRVEEGRVVRAGEVLASGGLVAAVHDVRGARHIGVQPADLDRVTRVRPVAPVSRGTVMARTGRRFARAVTSPAEGHLVHITTDGDFYVAPPLARWTVRSTMDGRVVRSTAGDVTVEGEAWWIQGLAGYGPDAIGELAVAVDAPDQALAPSRVDVRMRDRIVVGGARVAAEAITRAHACGVGGLVAGAAPAGGLRVVYGDEASSRGGTAFDDRPTVLCLIGFGSAPLPASVFDTLRAFGESRAAIHTASARLFVFAPRETAHPGEVPALALADTHDAVRPFDSAVEPAGTVRLPSEIEVPALLADGHVVPLPNVLPFDARR